MSGWRKSAPLVLLTAMGLLVGWNASGFSAAENGPPRTVLESFSRDLGRLSQDQRRTVEFTVRNAGGRRLVLSPLSGACCGEEPPPPRIVAPGETATLTIQFDASRWAGAARSAVEYATNDPKLPRFTLEARAFVTGVAASGHPAR